MKAHIQIPKGWRRVQDNWMVSESDLCMNTNLCWASVPRESIGYPSYIVFGPVIRRVARKGGK